MTQREFIDSVSKLANLSKIDTTKLYHAFFQVIRETLQSGGKINIKGFGTFKVSKRSEYEGYDPRNGQKMMIPATKKVIFKSAKSLKDGINQNNTDNN